MFEKALLNILQNDPELSETVSTYGSGSRPSIFSDFAPEGAELPYIVFRITYVNQLDTVVHRFSVMADYFDYQKSAVAARSAAFRIQYLLDRRKFESDRYGAIRLFHFGGGMVVEDDPRAIHYNIEFDGRAGRKAWGRHNITTYGE
jgi:hypothetical protein